MAAGKSAQLLQAAFNYREGGHKIELFTAALDDRYGVGQIASRIGLKASALTFDATTDFGVELRKLGKVACVLIDEGQFLLRSQVVAIHQFVHSTNTPVLVYGLRTDFQGHPFEGSAWLLALADDASELRSVCPCGRKASMNARFNEAGERERSGESILIGGNSRYKALCPKCHYQV
jgi:thymidine kinase